MTNASRAWLCLQPGSKGQSCLEGNSGSNSPSNLESNGQSYRENNEESNRLSNPSRNGQSSRQSSG